MKSMNLVRVLNTFILTVIVLPCFAYGGGGGGQSQLPSHVATAQEHISVSAMTENLEAHIIDNYLVPQNICNSTSDSHRVLRGRNKDSSVDSTQAEYNMIVAQEHEIERVQDELTSDHFAADGFMKNIVTPLQNGQPLNQEYLNEWEKRHSSLIQERAELTSKKQNYFAHILHDSLHKEAEKYIGKKGSLNEEQKKTLARIDEVFQEWKAARHIIGESAHPKFQKNRMYPLQELYERARELMVSFGKADPLPSVLNPNKTQRIKGGILTAATAVKLGAQLIRRNDLPSFLRGKPEKNSTPFTQKGGLTSLVQNMADKQGYHVKVEGEENLKEISLNVPTDPNKKVVNLFVPAHRHTSVDAMAMGNIGMPHFNLVANVKFAIPNVTIPIIKQTINFKKRAAALDDFIAVDPDKEFTKVPTPDKMIQSSNKNISPNLLDYPQSITSTNGEFIGITPTFVPKLAKRYLEEGYEVNLVPIDYDTDSRALSYTGSVDDRNVTVRILKPILHKAAKVLIEKQMEALNAQGPDAVADPRKAKVRYIDHFLNAAWVENVKKHGELTVDEMMDRAERNLGMTLNPHTPIEPAPPVAAN